MAHTPGHMDFTQSLLSDLYAGGQAGITQTETMEQATTAPNPQCEESVCTPSFWVPERGLCIYCGYRK